VRLFFVCGAPKSGTTWLQRVLDAHPQVACSGEGHFIQRFSVPLATIIQDYNRHLNLVANQVYEGEPYYQALDQAQFDKVVREFVTARLMERKPGPAVRWIGDKTPRYTHDLMSLRRIFPDARIINIVRDPRDVAMSRLQFSRRAGAGARLQDAAARAETMRPFTTDWVASVEPIGRFVEAHPGILHNLRYEDLLADPHAEAERLFDFLGVSTDRSLLNAIIGRTSFEAVSGRKPGDEDPSAFLRKGVVGDWVGRLGAASLEIIETACGELMIDHGYALSGQSPARVGAAVQSPTRSAGDDQASPA